jgi:pyrroline-5-carboxylate reductase
VVTQRALLAVIGGGNMGAALAQGLLQSGRSTNDLAICEVSAERRTTLAGMLPGVVVTTEVPACSEAIIAVKPADAIAACRQAVAAGARRVLSIVAGVRLAALQDACGSSVRVVRAMPNTPALVGLSATAFSVSASCTAEDRGWAGALLQSIGMVVELDESMLDAFTGLVGSGPAYVFYLAEALRDAAIAEGFDARLSGELVARVLVGAAALLEREPQSAKELRARVTSPKGTTAAGVGVLDDRSVHDAVVAAVHAATQRSKQLGDA